MESKNALIGLAQKKDLFYMSCGLISIWCTSVFDATRPSRLSCRYIIESLPLYASI